MNDKHDLTVVKTSNAEWVEAQEYEKNTWVTNNQRNGNLKIAYKFLKSVKSPKHFLNLLRFKDFYCGDDWNYWWAEKFEYYRDLPKSINRSLEIGSGPYSNTRLISQMIKLNDIVCLDPLMDKYLDFKKTWVSEMASHGKIKTITGKAEKIDFSDGSFDLVICNNVLDHVEDAEQCFAEMFRVLAVGGYFIFGQDLREVDDLEHVDEGHPIVLNQQLIDNYIDAKYTCIFKRILRKTESRRPLADYGTYIYVGKKIITSEL